MSDIDEKKPAGKAGKRKKHAEQRNRKADHKPVPKADPQRSAKPQIDAVLAASTGIAPGPAKAPAKAARPNGAQPSPIIAAVEPVPLALQASTLKADTAILAAETIAVAAQDASGPSIVPMASATAPVVAPPLAARDVRKPPAAASMSVEPTRSVAPVATPKLREPTVAPPAAEISAEAATVPAADVSVSLQTIANAYSEYTRKSLEQTKCFFDKLTGVRSLEQAVEIQTEFAKQACETFVAEAQRIHDLHRELARQRFERLEGLMTMGAQASC